MRITRNRVKPSRVYMSTDHVDAEGPYRYKVRG